MNVSKNKSDLDSLKIDLGVRYEYYPNLSFSSLFDRYCSKKKKKYYSTLPKFECNHYPLEKSDQLR